MFAEEIETMDRTVRQKLLGVWFTIKFILLILEDMKIATTIINRYQLGQFRVKYGFAERVTSELFNPYTR